MEKDNNQEEKSKDEGSNEKKEGKEKDCQKNCNNKTSIKDGGRSSTVSKKNSGSTPSKKQEKTLNDKMQERKEKELKEENGKVNKTGSQEHLTNDEKKKNDDDDMNFNKKPNNEKDSKAKIKKTPSKVQQKIQSSESIKKQNNESPKKNKKLKLKSDPIGKETSKEKQKEKEGRRRCESETLVQKRIQKSRVGHRGLQKMYSVDQTPTPASPLTRRKASLNDSDSQLYIWSEELDALNYVEGIRRGIDSKKLPPPPAALQPAQQTQPLQQQIKGGTVTVDPPKVYEVPAERLLSNESSAMNQSNCPLYFGVKSYLHHFYGSIDEKLIRDHEDDFEYMIGPSGEKELPLIVGNYSDRGCRCGARACRRFWLRAGLWGGANFLLVGLIALLVGYLTPPRATLVAYHDNIEIVDHWAIIFNKRLEVCRLAGLAVFCTGGVVLLIALLAFTFCSECPRCSGEKHEDLNQHQPIVINPVRIPISEQVRSVQPAASGQAPNFIIIQ